DLQNPGRQKSTKTDNSRIKDQPQRYKQCQQCSNAAFLLPLSEQQYGNDGFEKSNAPDGIGQTASRISRIKPPVDSWL
ncbi:hypothetical protein ACQUW0_27370, partial [Ralstonia pseudosolanacearum]|uniref:hypothetical protein n=1 Tax=Ralstonia pseudosolanacearum TaxID=1310165 RepID=UPI003D185D41